MRPAICSIQLPVFAAMLFALLGGLPPDALASEPETDATLPVPDPGYYLPPGWEPGNCAPLVQPPARIIPLWQSLDAEDAAAAAAAAEYTEIYDDTTATDEALEVAPVEEELDETEPASSPTPKHARTGPVTIEADLAELSRNDASRMSGNVWLQQEDLFLQGDAIRFDQSSGEVASELPARFGARDVIVAADEMQYNTNSGQGHFEDADFWLIKKNARGEANLIERVDDSHMNLSQVKYTSCPPGDEDWWLKASELELDQAEGVGTARNVRVAFMGVPFFYTPWISFPINNDRKTGFLFPELGTSNHLGNWLRVPYYLNLDPQYDATITPYYMSERGIRLDTSFRYLFGWGQGVLAADYLDHDRIADDSRYYYRFNHGSTLPGDWLARLNYREVSDPNYFQDFSTNGNARATSFLSQSFSLGHSEIDWGSTALLQRYQTVNEDIPEPRAPYEIWPRLSWYYSPLPLAGSLWTSVEGESTNFEHDLRISGWRHNAKASMFVDAGTPGLRLTPRVSLVETRYSLHDPVEGNVDLARELTISSLDFRARLDRAMAGGGTQTLEPRLYYLYIPYRDQDDVPRFDTRHVSNSLAALFRENRFTGFDRIGDENRLSAAVESRFVNNDGREWFNTAIARAWYFDDRRVGLTSESEPETSNTSNYYGEATWIPTDNHKFGLDLDWNPETEKSDVAGVQYLYRPSLDVVARLAYRFRRLENEDPLEQVDFSFAAPVTSKWRLFGKVVYALQDQHSQETLAGFEYESCCWVLRAFNRRYIFNRDGEFDQALWIQLELKGLASVGRRVDDLLENDIYTGGDSQ